MGRGLGAGFYVAGVVRRSKPLHPDGVVLHATLSRNGADPPWGVPWLDSRGESPALVRISRSVGLPAALPDIQGLAVRVDIDGRPADILLAGTGRRPVARALLVPRRTPRGFFSTLFPYRAGGSSLVLGAAAVSGPALPADPAELVDVLRRGPVRYQLSCASPTGPWRAFATLEVTAPAASDLDPPLSFDAVRNRPPGLELDDWAVRLRGPAYAGARRSRGTALATPSRRQDR